MPFEPIPVMDLMGGLVVRARAGERESYRPIENSKIATSADPQAVIDGLLRIYPFQTIYIADLDAIGARGSHANLVVDLDRRYPEIEFWVDAGFATPGDCAAFLASASATLVLGSESQQDATLIEGLAAEPRIVLSLDSKGARRLDPMDIFERPHLWPERLIAMTLARVGMAAGPDLERLGELRAIAPDRRVYAAGGVRDAGDLAALEAAGAAGVLIASAIHEGRMGAAELAGFPIPPRPQPRLAPNPPRVHHSIELTAEEDRQLGLAAARVGRTPQQFLRDGVRDLLLREPLDPPPST